MRLLLISIIFFNIVESSVFAQEIDTTQALVDELGPVIDSTLLEAQLDTLIKEVPQKLEVADRTEGPALKAPSLLEVISFGNIFWSLVVLVVGFFTIKYISKLLEFFAERSTKYRIMFKSIIPAVKILGWIGVVFLVIAGIIKPPAATVVAFSASIGVAVGFASQDILKNIFGGIMILFDRPFQSGDKIEVGSHYGEVVEIGLRSTRIVTPDDNLVSIPNSEIMNSSVSNANAGEANCQVVAELFLPANVNTVLARDIAEEVAIVSKYVYLNKPVSVVFSNEFKDKLPVVKMKIKAYVLDIRDEFKFKSELMELTMKQFEVEKVVSYSQLV